MSISRDLIIDGEHVPVLSGRTADDINPCAGTVHVDDQPFSDEPQAPFGGLQESGCGTFGGRAGVESFRERRWITVQEEGHARLPFQARAENRRRR